MDETGKHSLAGQSALVTGASRGIGRAIALHLARQGAYVGINFVSNEEAAASTLAEVTSLGGSGELLGFDVSDPEAASERVRSFAKSRGSLDILVNNAGLAIDGLILRYKPDDWDRIVRVNLGGAFHCARAAARSMVRARYGRIINLSSVVASMGNPGQVAYASTKAGLEGMTRSLALELAQRGITVNSIAPGMIDTEMTETLSDDVRAAYLTGIPAGRLGSAEEVAFVVGFLASREAGYITGQVLAVNGGMYV
jgi:3-oxoacyl-[acyl-carrier protein] reductase